MEKEYIIIIKISDQRACISFMYVISCRNIISLCLFVLFFVVCVWKGLFFSIPTIGLSWLPTPHQANRTQTTNYKLQTTHTSRCTYHPLLLTTADLIIFLFFLFSFDLICLVIASLSSSFFPLDPPCWISVSSLSLWMLSLQLLLQPPTEELPHTSYQWIDLSYTHQANLSLCIYQKNTEHPTVSLCGQVKITISQRGGLKEQPPPPCFSLTLSDRFGIHTELPLISPQSCPPDKT